MLFDGGTTLSTDDSTETVIDSLLGLKIFLTSHAADMREFGFHAPDPEDNSQTSEWFLHIQCAWRIESSNEIMTGSFDWFEPADPTRDTEPNWDPATGGSLQELKLREIFRDFENQPIYNQTTNFLVLDAVMAAVGDLVIGLSGGFRIRVFPAGSKGEFWRLFKKGDPDSHFVCEGHDK
jgi:hypothetical protein